MKSSPRRWLIPVLVVLLLLLVARLLWRAAPVATQSQPAPIEDSLSQIVKTGVMNVGYIDYPPAVIKDPRTGELSGEFVEIARYIAQQLNVKIQFHEASWSTFITG